MHCCSEAGIPSGYPPLIPKQHMGLIKEMSLIVNKGLENPHKLNVNKRRESKIPFDSPIFLQRNMLNLGFAGPSV